MPLPLKLLFVTMVERAVGRWLTGDAAIIKVVVVTLVVQGLRFSVTDTD